jgi:uncharacterized protein YqhQ
LEEVVLSFMKLKPSSSSYTSIGGQAVIEGVMMRSPHYIAVAVRKPNQKIAVRYAAYTSVSARFPILKKPVLRGVVTLCESMVQGIDALSYSAQVSGSSTDVKEEKLSSWAIATSMVTAFALGMGLFVALPHFVTVLITSQASAQIGLQSPIFHFIDGIFKMAILISYVYLIALMPEIKRVFQYHGAEHKSIYAFEKGLDLTVENARPFTTLHPRCGTSFLLFLVLISVVVFSILFPILGVGQWSTYPILNHFMMIVIKIVLMLPVAGIAYEFIKACSLRMQSPLFRCLIWPGMILQKLTTKSPDDEQLEVALVSLRQVLILEKTGLPTSLQQPVEIEVGSLLDLGPIHAQLAEFPEV